MAYAEVVNMHKVRRTLGALLGRRGYEVPSELTQESVEQFQQRYDDEAFDPTLRVVTSTGDTLVVFFSSAPTKLGVAVIRDFYVPLMHEQGVARSILVLQKGLTNPAVHAVAELPETHNVRIDCFKQEELLWDLMSHSKVPHHRVLSPSEKIKVMTRLCVTPDQLMVMRTADPVARYLGLSGHEVVEIRRETLTAPCLAYRIVKNTDTSKK